METASSMETLTLLTTDPMARIDAPHMAAQVGARVVSIHDADGVLTILVETPAAPPG